MRRVPALVPWSATSRSRPAPCSSGSSSQSSSLWPSWRAVEGDVAGAPGGWVVAGAGVAGGGPGRAPVGGGGGGGGWGLGWGLGRRWWRLRRVRWWGWFFRRRRGRALLVLTPLIPSPVGRGETGVIMVPPLPKGEGDR